MQFCQRDQRWTNTIFGNSTSTNKIGMYGCYLCSLVSGLSDRGYNYDPNTFNDLLKSVNAWVGPFGDYIDSANIDKYLPAIFTHFQKIDPWNDIPKVDNLVGENLIVVCRVNAKAIGGTGTHYLYLVGQQKGVALIYDPWRNVTEPITTTYGNYGDILGIDIFTVKVKSTLPAPQPVQSAPTPVEPPVTVPVTPEPTTVPESTTSTTTPTTTVSVNVPATPEQPLTPPSELPTTSDVAPVNPILQFIIRSVNWLLSKLPKRSNV